MIWLKKVKRRIAVGATPGVKFLATIVRTPNMTQDELEERIANATSLTPGDVSSVLKSMAFEIALSVSNGRSVETSLGMYQVQLKVTAVNTLEEVTVETVDKVNIRFFPNKKIQKIYEKASNKFSFVDVTPAGLQEPVEKTEP